MTLFVMAGALLLVPLHGWALIDMLQFPIGVWKQTGRDQSLWVVLVMFAPVVGPVVYANVVRPDLVVASKPEAM